ncbi:MAG TPA: tetratricopeptide repeat protein [Oculatellaceae cyanobacterium]
MNTQTDQLNYKFGLDTESTNGFNPLSTTLPTVHPQPASFSDLAAAPVVEAKIADAGAFREFVSSKVPKLTTPAPFTPKSVAVSGSAVPSASAPTAGTTPTTTAPYPRSTASRTERLNTIPSKLAEKNESSSQDADQKIAIKRIRSTFKVAGALLIATLLIGTIWLGMQKLETYKPTITMKVANCAAAVGAPSLALRIFDDNFNDKKYVNVLIEWANSSRSHKKFEVAMKYLNRAVELDPTSALAYNNRACTQVALGKYQAAVADFTEAIALEPDSVRYWMNRANCYVQMKQYKLAIQNYDFAIAHGNKSAVEQKAQVIKLMRTASHALHANHTVHVVHAKTAH